MEMSDKQISDLKNFIRRNFAVGRNEPTNDQLKRLHLKVSQLKAQGIHDEGIEKYIKEHFRDITGCSRGMISLTEAEDLTTFTQAMSMLTSLVQSGKLK
jgi:hypothetical protein